MPRTTTRPAAPTVALSSGWYQHRRAAGYRTDAEVAVAMGVDPSTVYRIQRGDSPSSAFIAAALTTFDTTFEELFRVVQPKPTRRAA